MADIYGGQGGMMLGLPPEFQQAYLSDPRNQTAFALMQQGSSVDPVYTPIQGLARALMGGLGGYERGNVIKDYKQAGQDYYAGERNLWGIPGPTDGSPGGDPNAQTAAALGGSPQPMATNGSAPPQGSPQPQSPAPIGGPGQTADPIAAMRARALAAVNSQNPMIQRQGFEMLQGLASKDYESAIALKQTMAAKGLVQDGSGNWAEAPGFGAAQGQIAADTASGGGNQAAVSLQGALMPGAVRQAGATSAATEAAALPYKVQLANAEAAVKNRFAASDAFLSAEGTRASDEGSQKFLNGLKESLGKDYTTEPIVVARNQLRFALGGINAAVRQHFENPGNKSVDIALAQQFVQMLAPGAQFKPGSVDLITSPVGVPDYALKILQEVKGGPGLTDETVRGIQKTADDQFATIEAQHKGIVSSFTKRIDSSGKKIDPNEIMPDLLPTFTTPDDPKFKALPSGSPFYKADGTLAFKN